MPMTHNGLSKLIEECGEVLQVAGKLLQYPEGEHPDGKGDLLMRLQHEMGDTVAAMSYVCLRLDISQDAVEDHAAAKFALFRQWASEA